jgi:hypothetical protein
LPLFLSAQPFWHVLVRPLFLPVVCR